MYRAREDGLDLPSRGGVIISGFVWERDGDFSASVDGWVVSPLPLSWVCIFAKAPMVMSVCSHCCASWLVTTTW